MTHLNKLSELGIFKENFKELNINLELQPSKFLLVQRFLFKACVRYFLSNFYFSPNDSPSKTMKNVFYFIEKALFVLEIFKFLYFRLPLFFTLSAIALEVDPRKILKFMMPSTV